MSVLSSLARNFLLSVVLVLMVCLLESARTELLRNSATTTTTTSIPFIRRNGLSLPVRNSYPPKCWREVPAVFFQYEKDVPIIGNSSVNMYYNLIEVCCKGYKRYEYEWSECVPDCGTKCQHNGFCVEGGVCKCFDEFVQNHRNECIPTCPLGCPHGQCYLNGTCVCNKGWELDPTKRYCMPKCELACGHNEICAEPNRCECLEGYSKSLVAGDHMGCQPVCIPDCGYGRCVGPNECECFHGYMKRMNGSVCESNCYLRCENGFCVNRTTCVCHSGYKFDYNTSSCLPDCDDNCENGVCMSPGNCRCFNGYQREGAKCIGICKKQGCGYYGKCIGPDICGCALIDGQFDSYQLCKRGACTSQGRCRCDPGTTRFINECMSTDKVTTYAATHHVALNASFVKEFNLLIGRYFNFTETKWQHY